MMAHLVCHFYRHGKGKQPSMFLNGIWSTLQKTLFLQYRNTSDEEKWDPKDPALRFFKWGFKPLPTQTIFDGIDPILAVHSPKFQLPKKCGRISRKMWRQKIAEIQLSRSDPELEKLARNRQLYVDLDLVEKEWRNEFGLYDLIKLSRFYGITRDIFDNEDIVAKTWLDISFNDIKIHRGNFLQPNQLLSPPSYINYRCSKEDLHTLILLNLDGHPITDKKEIIHWMLCDIRGNNIHEGRTIYKYLPPIPFKGTGFNRFVFVLLQQKRLNLEKYSSDEQSIQGRTFSTQQFISENELTPISLSWCQMEWDESVTETCKIISDLPNEPRFDWEDYIPPKEEAKVLNKKLSELSYRNM